MTAQEFMKVFEDRGYQFRLHPKGGFVIIPTPQLTDNYRANLNLVAADLERLLREREAARARELSPAQPDVIDQTLAGFPGSQLLEIKPVEIRPGVPLIPARKAPEQSRLFASGVSQKPVPVSESATPAGVRVCPHCAHPCHDRELVRCKNCGTPLPVESCPPEEKAVEPAEELVETVSPAKEEPAVRPPADENQPATPAGPMLASEPLDDTAPLVVPEVVGIDAPEPEVSAPMADSTDDPDDNGTFYPLATPDAEVASTRTPRPVCNPQPRTQTNPTHIEMEITVIRARTAHGSGLELEVSSPQSANIRVRVEENDPWSTRQFKPGRLLVERTGLPCRGFRLFRRTAALRLRVEVQR
jgi:hypothetical protein